MAEPAAAQSTGIDCLSPEAQRLAEARLAAKRAARAEAREIRMKELERQQKEVEERPDKDFTEKGSRSLPGLSAATLASLGGTSSRRGSGDTSISMDTEASIREIKDSLAEVEEKYKKAMVSNAQLDNEKTKFMYQVDTLKDMLLELEEQLAEAQRQYEEKSKEFEREKHAHSILQFQFAEVKEALKQREEMLEKHGIVLNSEITTNGETADTLNNVGHQGPTRLTKEEVNALKAAGDGPLGRASEVEVKSKIVENVGEKGILQNTEQEQHKEDPARERVDTEVFHPGGDAKDQKFSEDRAPSLGVVANGPDEEQGQKWDLENPPSIEDTEQVESSGVTDMPDDRTVASLGRSSCSGELDGGSPGAAAGHDGYDASDVRNQRRESGEAQEDLQTSPGAGSAEPGQDSASPQISEVGGLASVDDGEQGGSPTEGVVEAGLPGLGEQAGTVASGPPRYSGDAGSDDEKHMVDAPTELDPSSGHDLEKKPARQGLAELKEFPAESTAVGGESDEKEDQERALRAEKPTQTEVQNVPCCPAAKSRPQGAVGPSVADPESEPLDTKEPEEGKNDQQGEALDSSQKKTKNKKKKNKKKKPPTPVESLNDVKKELTFQNPDLSEVKEEEQVNFTDEKSAVEAQDEVPESPKKERVAGSSGNVGGPENPKVELNEKLNQEDNDVNTTAGEEAADGDTSGPGDDPTQSSAGDEEPDEALVRDEADEDGAAAGIPEPGSGDAPSSALLENGGPLEDLNGASQTGSPEPQEMTECPSQTVGKVVENEDDSAVSGELGASDPDLPRGGSEKSRSKEDCALS